MVQRQDHFTVISHTGQSLLWLWHLSHRAEMDSLMVALYVRKSFFVLHASGHSWCSALLHTRCLNLPCVTIPASATKLPSALPSSWPSTTQGSLVPGHVDAPAASPGALGHHPEQLFLCFSFFSSDQKVEKIKLFLPTQTAWARSTNVSRCWHSPQFPMELVTKYTLLWVQQSQFYCKVLHTNRSFWLQQASVSQSDTG